MAALVERGLRAQLKSGNLLTGELLVDLDFHPDSPPAKLDRSGTYPEIPAVPAELEALEASVTAVLTKLAALPLPELVDDLRRTIQGVDGLVTLARHQAGGRRPDPGGGSPGGPDRHARSAGSGRCSPRRSRRSLRPTGWSAANAQLRYDLNALLKELTGAARSIRVFADYLERHPDALIRGKTGAQ